MTISMGRPLIINNQISDVLHVSLIVSGNINTYEDILESLYLLQENLIVAKKEKEKEEEEAAKAAEKEVVEDKEPETSE